MAALAIQLLQNLSQILLQWQEDVIICSSCPHVSLYEKICIRSIFSIYSYSVVHMVINFAPIHFLILTCMVTTLLVRHIQKHLSEITGESKENQDVKDVAAGDNDKGDFYFIVHQVT